MLIKPQIQTPEKLLFLEKLCWQREDIENLTPLEMLRIYERGWHYRGVLGDLSHTEALFVQQLAQYYSGFRSYEVQS